MISLRLLLPLTVAGLLSLAFRQDRPAPDEAPDEHRFRKVDLTGNLHDLVELDIAPNGDVYYIGHHGAVYVHQIRTRKNRQIGTIDAQPSEATLQAIALDPNFAQNRQLYLYYAPKDTKNVNVLSRFTLRGDSLDLRSEIRMLEVPDSWQCCHAGGGMAFDRHGNLYLTTGDNTNPFGTNYAPIDERPGRELYDAQRSSANTNDLRGKILRIHPEPDGSYTIPKGNLFADDTDPLTRPEIYVMGCRNPFHLTIDRDTDFLYWSEVGPDASDKDPRGPRGYDELNQARKAGNHGWPLFIGKNEPYSKVDFTKDSVLFQFDPLHPVNTSVNNTGRRELPPAQPAFLAYPYDVSDEFPEFGSGGRTLVAGPMYYFDPKNPSPIKFPAYFDRKLFLGEWMRNWLKTVSFDAQQNLKAIESFMPSTAFRKPIAMKFGPDGALYLIEFGALWGGNHDSRLTRIEYIAGNRPPIARLDASTDAGGTPLRVRFSGKNSLDYDRNDALTYRWSVNGKPLPQTTPELAYTFQKPGNYRVKLLVSDRAGLRSEAETVVSAGNQPPTVAIELDEPGRFYGPSVSYRVRADDPEDGPIHPDQVQVKLTYLPTRKTVSLSDKGELQPPHQRGRTWIEENDCKACHALNEQSVGPSFRAIAARYQPQKADPALVERLSQKILKGGLGVWGQVNMSAHPQLSDDVTTEMVRYILSLSDEKAEKKLPGQGSFSTEPNPQGTYVLTARYTDKGFKTARPLTRQATVVLRPSVLTAQDFDAYHELSHRDVLFNVHKAAWVLMRQLDLTGIHVVDFTLAATLKGTVVEARLDGPEGELVGELHVPQTGKQQWTEKSMPIKPVTGPRDLYFVFRNRLTVVDLIEVKEVRFRKDIP